MLYESILSTKETNDVTEYTAQIIVVVVFVVVVVVY